jgi:hypothetical protein
MLRLFSGVVVLAAAMAPAGCTAVLGDFTSSPGDDGAGGDGSVSSSGGSSGGGPSDGSGSSSGGGDATMPGDGGPPPDGAVDAGPLHELTCNTWDQTTPTLVLKIFAPEGGSSGGGNNNGIPIYDFLIEHIPGMNAARMLVETNSGGSIVTLSESGGPATVLPIGLNVQAERKTAMGMTLLAQDNTNNTYGYYTIADDDPATASSAIVGPQGPTVGALPSTGSGGVNNTQMDFVPLPDAGYYALASYQTAGSYQAASWLPGAATWNVVIPAGGNFQIGGSSLLVDGTDAYGFYAPPGSGGGAPAALEQYTFPTTSPLGPASRSILAASETAATGAVAPGPNGSYSLAFIELGGAQTASLRLGNVPEANIHTFMVDDLASLDFNLQSDGGFFDTTPFGGTNGSMARWLSNGDLGALGGGGTGGGAGSSTGLNFYVATPSGQWLVETGGSGKNILPGQVVLGSAFDLAQAVNEILLKFDIAWVVQEADGGYALYFNVLDCNL